MTLGISQKDWEFSSPQLVSCNMWMQLTKEQVEFLDKECELYGLKRQKYMQCLLESYRIMKVGGKI